MGNSFKRFFAAFLFCAAASCGGSDQISGMYQLAFSTTAACSQEQKMIQFKNDSDQTLEIQGVAIAGGTDPEGNFSLKSVVVGTQTSPSRSGGVINKVSVPPQTSYGFVVAYNPQAANKQSTALLDIAYTSPKEGVVQVTLDGASTAGSANCSGSVTPPTGGQVTLDGPMTITIERIALVTDAVSLPITTDLNDTQRPFQPVTLSIVLNRSNNTVTLKAIATSDKFILPPSRTAPLDDLIPADTVLSSKGDASGSYTSDGSLTVNQVPIHLSENASPTKNFEADFDVTLTTGSIPMPKGFAPGSLKGAGFTLSGEKDKTQILGSSIDPKTFKVILVGSSNFINGTGVGTLAQQITGKTGVVLIQATIIPPIW